MSKHELESEFQTELDRAASARSNHGIRRGRVRRGASASERLGRRIVVSEAILAAERIGEVGMIENVEKFGAELRAETLAELPHLRHGEIPVAESGVVEFIASHCAESAES